MKNYYYAYAWIFTALLTLFVTGNNITYAEASLVHDKDIWTITLIGNDWKKFVLEDKNVWANRARDWESLVTEESRWLLYNWGVNTWYDMDDTLPKYDHKTVEWWWWLEDSTDSFLWKELTAEEQLKRQWPCQEWYHIPSIWEWISIMKAWCDYDEQCSDSDYSYFYWEKLPYITMKDWYWERFAKDLLLPRVWSRTSNFDFTDRGDGKYWSSSQYNRWWPNFYLYSFTDEVIAHEWNWWYHAMNIRCLENKKDELFEAYEWAYDYWITTQPTFKQAKMNSPITRIAMAKMLSNYAINILWKKPDTSKWEKQFIDVTTKQNNDYNNAVTLSYQLWIMWQWTNKFRPNDEVTRAEFATALSRMLYNTSDGQPYYITHLKKLKQEWIITNDNPRIKEKRWYVMLMLMRSAK